LFYSRQPPEAGGYCSKSSKIGEWGGAEGGV
jgi:hypothetical protein